MAYIVDVLPVPGSPYSNTPNLFGNPRVLNKSLLSRNNLIALCIRA